MTRHVRNSNSKTTENYTSTDGGVTITEGGDYKAAQREGTYQHGDPIGSERARHTARQRGRQARTHETSRDSRLNGQPHAQPTLWHFCLNAKKRCRTSKNTYRIDDGIQSVVLIVNL